MGNRLPEQPHSLNFVQRYNHFSGVQCFTDQVLDDPIGPVVIRSWVRQQISDSMFFSIYQHRQACESTIYNIFAEPSCPSGHHQVGFTQACTQPSRKLLRNLITVGYGVISSALSMRLKVDLINPSPADTGRLR